MNQPTIEHVRDIIHGDDGRIEQIYNHLVYRFTKEGVVARAYLDEPDKVSIMSGGDVPDAVLDYFKDRFWQIDRIGRSGYVMLWTAE